MRTPTFYWLLVNPDDLANLAREPWIPASAGMTDFRATKEVAARAAPVFRGIFRDRNDFLPMKLYSEYCESEKVWPNAGRLEENAHICIFASRTGVRFAEKGPKNSLVDFVLLSRSL